MDTGSRTAGTYEWDAEQRLVAVNTANQRTEFSYDGIGRRIGIRQLINGSEVSNRRFVWCDDEICEERTSAGVVSKGYFTQGMEVETGPTAGKYFYTSDHHESHSINTAEVVIELPALYHFHIRVTWRYRGKS